MPSQNLNVALIALDMRWADVKFNLDMAVTRIAALPSDTDLVLLPEMATTGFGAFPGGVEKWAEDADGPTLSAMREASVKYGVAIYGGFIGRCGDRAANRSYFVADGEIKALYDKRHLFAGAEQRDFARGECLPPIVDYKSWRLMLSICYDVRFPVWLRNVANNYDAMLVIANWPNSRYYAWKHLLIARAIENQAYVAACNREGEDVYGQYARGDSMIVNSVGVPVGTTLEDGTVIGKFDHEALDSIRSSVRPWRVADEFTLTDVRSEGLEV